MKISQRIFLLAVGAVSTVSLTNSSVLAQTTVDITPTPINPGVIDRIRVTEILPTVCRDRGLTRQQCANFFSQLQDARILENLRLQRVPEIRIPDRCLSCPPLQQINPNFQLNELKDLPRIQPR